jgi:biotin carboxyl carrier protein
MKRYQITVGGRSFEVWLLSDPHQDRVEVEVDGQPLVVDVRDLDFEGGDEGPHGLEPIPGIKAAAPSPATAPSVPAGGAHSPPPPGTLAGQPVIAPLPGVVKSITVQPGQRVDPGDELLVIEAMKMDNVIRAPRQGVVHAVRVAEGHRVAHGDVMIEFRG